MHLHIKLLISVYLHELSSFSYLQGQGNNCLQGTMSVPINPEARVQHATYNAKRMILNRVLYFGTRRE